MGALLPALQPSLAQVVEPMGGGAFFVIGTLLLLVAIGAPLFVVLGATTIAAIIAFPETAAVTDSLDGFTENLNLIERMTELIEQPSFVAIPFFMIAGAIMSQGAIAKRLVDFASSLVGWMPGGLALTSIIACMFFAAISGSSPVTVITIGAIMLPALASAGYPESMSVGLVTSAGTLGIIIPPSIPMIVYAIFASSAGPQVKVDDLFVAGVGPGILIAGALAVYCIVRGKGVARLPFEGKQLVQSFLDGIWALFLPLFIIGGIYVGLFNATEAAAISVVLALIIELYIHRSLTFDQLPKILAESAVLMGSILIIIAVAFGFMELMAIKKIPEQIVTWLAQFELTPVTFVLLLNVLLLIVGCLMDIISAIILFVPLLVPIATPLGFDPVHLGLIFIVNLEIGYLTPPLGLNLFVATTYFEKPFGMVIKSVAPYLLMLMASLAIVTYVPTISVGLVNLKNDRPFWSEFPSGTVLSAATRGKSATESLDDEAELFDDDSDLPDAPDDTDEGDGSDTIPGMMDDPEYRKLMKEFGGEGDNGAGEDAEDGDGDAEGDEDEDEGADSIQDMMKDPEYRKLMKDFAGDDEEAEPSKAAKPAPQPKPKPTKLEAEPEPEPEPDDDDDDDAGTESIQDMMKDPEYRKLMKEFE